MSLSVSGATVAHSFLRPRVDRPVEGSDSAVEMRPQTDNGPPVVPFDQPAPAKGMRMSLLQQLCKAGVDASGIALDDRAALEALLTSRAESGPTVAAGSVLNVKA